MPIDKYLYPDSSNTIQSKFVTFVLREADVAKFATKRTVYYSIDVSLIHLITS